MDHYVTLVSNASMDLFPYNKRSSFRTRLPYVHDFSEGNWLVALSEITYSKSWFNVGDGHTVTPAMIHDGQPVDAMKSDHKTAISPGFYHTPSELIEHINSLMSTWQTPASVTKLPELMINTNGIVSLKTMGIVKEGSATRQFGALFDNEMSTLLGIANSRPAFLDQGMTSLYVYCDILQPQVVGDSFEPLLRTIGVDSNARFGENVTEIFDYPYYLPLARTVFQEIEINIRNDIGEAPPFNFGRTTVTLHFVKQP